MECASAFTVNSKIETSFKQFLLIKCLPLQHSKHSVHPVTREAALTFSWKEYQELNMTILLEVYT
jgi:hypothetical protein